MATTEDVQPFIDAVQHQVSDVTNLSIFGGGVALLMLARLSGLLKDEYEVRGFRYRFMPMTSLILFSLAICLSYLIDAAVTGYFAEEVVGYSKGPREHFISEYAPFISYASSTQLILSIFALLFLVVWVIINVVKRKRG